MTALPKFNTARIGQIIHIEEDVLEVDYAFSENKNSSRFILDDSRSLDNDENNISQFFNYADFYDSQN